MDMKSQITGLPLDFPNWGSGPLLVEQTFRINSASALFNWNPSQTALISYFDPNLGATVTQSFPIGGSFGPTDLTITTGSYSVGDYAANTRITVLPNDFLPTLLPGFIFQGPLKEFFRAYGLSNRVESGLSSSSNFTIDMVESNTVELSGNSTYLSNFLNSLGIDSVSFYGEQGLNYPFVGSTEGSGDRTNPSIGSFNLLSEHASLQPQPSTTITSSNPLVDFVSGIGSWLFGDGRASPAAPALGAPIGAPGNSPGYPASTAQRMKTLQ